MITTMRGCVVHHDLWPWPLSSRSFGLDLENRVRSVASTVLDGFFLYLAQMITIIRRCVACYVFFRIWKFKILANFWNFSALTLKKKSTILDGFFPYLTQMITSMRRCVAYNDLWPWPISSRLFSLDLENRVLSVASTVLDGFFPYVVQMITSMRRCVACDDLWPWPISSRSFDLDFENRVRSVASTVLDGFFLHLAQMITIIRRCVACYVFFRIWKFKILANFWNFSALTLKKKSTILAGFFPYLTQMITSMRRCVAYNDLWPWPISSRSFGLDLENRVLSVASTVLDGFFPYVVQMITSMRRCVACDDLWPWPISSRSFGLDFENRVRSVTFSVLDWLFFWLGIQYDSIMWVIMRQRGVSSERRRSSWTLKLTFLRWMFVVLVCGCVGLIYIWADSRLTPSQWDGVTL